MTTEERLEKLEKELAGAKRHSRVMLMAAALIVAVVFLLGAGGDEVQKVVRAEKFELVDSNGTNRAVMCLKGRVGPVLVLSGANGNCRALLSVLEDEVKLELCDGSGASRAALRVTETEGPTLSLGDQNRVRIWLGMFNGKPTLSLWDQNGEVRALLGVGEEAGPSLGLRDRNGKLRALLDVTESGAPVLGLYDRNGEKLWSAP